MQRFGFLLMVFVVLSCSSRDDYFVGSSPDPRVRELYELVQQTTDPSERVIAVERLAGHLLQDRGPTALNAFLTSLVDHDPDDPYGAYYLFLVGQNYLDHEAPDFARYYFDRVVSEYPEVELRGRSLTREALHHLVRLTESPTKRARYYRTLIEDHSDAVDLGLMHYRLAETYEELADWDNAYAAYRTFLQFPTSTIPQRPNAHRDVAAQIAFFDSDRNWMVPTLTELQRGITAALASKNEAAFLRYQAEVNFFTRSWEQDFEDPNVSGFWDIGEILRLTLRITVDPTIDLDDDGDEALLRTFGWGTRIRTWYLYFRKVDFPADPEIHGSWEWAGIFLGERI